MGHTSTTVFAPITISGSNNDVGTALGVASTDWGTLCKHDNINPWAMFKPVRNSSVRMVNRPDFDSSAVLESLGFGGTLPSSRTVQGFLNLYADTATLGANQEPANGWHYLHPRGHANNEEFRILDFACVKNMTILTSTGYDHAANNPFGTFTCDRSVSNQGGRFGGSQQKIVPSSDMPDTNIVINSFNQQLGNTSKMWYYGILLDPGNTSYAYHLIGNKDTKITDNMPYRGHEQLQIESNFYLTSSGFPVGTYTAYPFLTNLPMPTGLEILVAYSERNTNLSDGRILYPLPGSIPLSVNVYQFSVVITLEATPASWVGSTLDTSLRMTIKNNSSSSVTINNFMLKWRKGSNYSAARQSGEVFYSKAYRWDDQSGSGGVADNTYASFLADRTIASGAEVVIPGAELWAFAEMPNEDANKVYVGFSMSGQDIYGGTTIIVPIRPTLTQQ